MALNLSTLQEKKLWLACESGDVSTAQEAIRNSANVNWENPEDKVSSLAYTKVE